MVSEIEQQSTAVSVMNVSSAPKDIKIAMEEGREAKSIFREVLCRVPPPPIAVANLMEPAPTLPALSLPSLQPPREEIDETGRTGKSCRPGGATEGYFTHQTMVSLLRGW
jgi:hypothetical protein